MAKKKRLRYQNRLPVAGDKPRDPPKDPSPLLVEGDLVLYQRIPEIMPYYTPPIIDQCREDDRQRIIREINDAKQMMDMRRVQFLEEKLNAYQGK